MDNEAKFRYVAFDMIEIDLVGRRMTVAGTETALEPKVFDVLVLLAQTPGKAFGRDEILDTVWGHRHITSSVLNRVILRIRHALKDSANRLHTLYGIGYRFDGEVRFSTDRDNAAASAPNAGDAFDAAAVQIGEPTDTRAGSSQVGSAAIAATGSLSSSPRAGYRAVLRKPSYAGLLVLLLAAFAVVVLVLLSRQSSTPSANAAPMPIEGRSIAVLPLHNAGGEDDQRFFSDGISENLINTLSQLEGLKVIGRSSSFRFRGSKEDSKTIGEKLGVAHLIEGSVQRIGDDVRISIQLIRSADSSTVWSQRFDRAYKDLFALQDEITLAVAAALQVKLLHGWPIAVEKGHPASGNLEAYEAYLQGTYYMGEDNARKAIEQFERATQLDPGYAQAWSWLAFQRTDLARFELNGEAARSTYARARRDVDTALRLRPNFGHAHAIRANWLSSAEHDWDGALAEFRVATQLVPDTDPMHGGVSNLLATLGRVNEAIAERRKAIEGNPLDASGHIRLADLLASVGRLDEAEASLRKAADVEPDRAKWVASKRIGLAILRGDAVTAQSLAEAGTDWPDRDLALALQNATDHAAADAALQRLIENDGQNNAVAYQVARVHALRGDADKTFEWLQRDWGRGNASVHIALFDPLLLRFRDDPRFAEYCKTAGLPPPSASEALGIDRIRATYAAKR